MPGPTKIISYNGYDFAANDWLGIPGDDQGSWSITPTIEQRQGAPALYTGATVSERGYPVKFLYRGASNTKLALNALMGALDPLNVTMRTLVIEQPDGTQVSCDAVVQVTAPDDDRELNTLRVIFLTVDPFWTALTPTTVGPTTINAGSPSMSVSNPGATTVYPEIVRSAPTSAFTATQAGRRKITISNSSLLPLERETIIIRPVDDPSIAAATILLDGTYYPCTALLGVSTGVDVVAFPATVDAGGSEIYQLLGKTNPVGNLDNYTLFDGNYSALDLSFEKHTATAGSTAQITDGTAAWTTNQWAGACLWNLNINERRCILSNTATQLTPVRAFNTAAASGHVFLLIGTGYYLDGGKASSATSTTLTDSSQSWDTDTLIGGSVNIIGGTGAGAFKQIIDNTGTQVTIDSPWSVTPDTTSVYAITRPFYHRYWVDQVKASSTQKHRGGWQQNKRYTRPSKILWGADILNAWEPFLLLDNNDDFNQSRACPITLGGSDVDYFPILDADRRKGQERLLAEEGQADGVAVYHPWGYMGIRFDYQQKNPNTASGATKGICKFVLAGREAGGDEFEFFVEDDTLRTSLTSVAEQFVNLTAYGSPEQLYMGQVPVDEVEVDDSASDNDTATVRWGAVLRLWVDLTSRVDVSIGNLETAIPVEDEVRVGDYALQIGMRDGERLWLKSTGDTLHLDCEAGRAWIDNAGTITDVTYAVHPILYEDRDGDGVDETYLADKWLPLSPGSNTVTATGAPWASAGAFSLTFTFPTKVYG